MNKKKRTTNTLFLSQAGLIAALYAALVYLQNMILPNSATLAVQVRVAEALAMLSVITPAAIPGLTLGCFIANLTSIQVMPLDLIFGTLATFLSSVCMYKVRDLRIKSLPIIASVLPALFNGVIIGLELTFFVPHETGSSLILFLTQGGLVALGEIISVMALGLPFIRMVEKRNLFGKFNHI